MIDSVAEISIETMSLDDKLILLERIWNSLAEVAPLPVPQWHLAVLKRRSNDPDERQGSVTLAELQAVFHGDLV